MKRSFYPSLDAAAKGLGSSGIIYSSQLQSKTLTEQSEARQIRHTVDAFAHGSFAQPQRWLNQSVPPPTLRPPDENQSGSVLYRAP